MNGYYEAIHTTVVSDRFRDVIGDGRSPPAGKQGHKCCGGCCDTRRAVIIVNTVNAIMISMSIISIYLLKEVYNEPNYYHGFGNAGIYRTISVLRIFICIIGIIGALYYKIHMIGFTVMMYLLDAIMNFIGFNPMYSIVSLLFAYPHFFLMSEIKNDIMTPDNYHNEEHSCCCI